MGDRGESGDRAVRSCSNSDKDGRNEALEWDNDNSLIVVDIVYHFTSMCQWQSRSKSSMMVLIWTSWVTLSRVAWVAYWDRASVVHSPSPPAPRRGHLVRNRLRLRSSCWTLRTGSLWWLLKTLIFFKSYPISMACPTN